MTAHKPKKGDRFRYTGGFDLEIMTSPPLHVSPNDRDVTADSASQAQHMADSADFERVTGKAG